MIIAINFDEYKASRIVLLLNHIEAGDAGLFYALASVGQRDAFKILDALRLHVNVDVDDEHFFEEMADRPKIG